MGSCICGSYSCPQCHPPIMRIDKPHGSRGQHVDSIVCLYDVPGAHKVRIGGDGSILSDEVKIKEKNWP